MKWMKRTAALGAAALLALSLTACSGGNADETVAAALEKVKGAASVDAVIEMAAEYTSEDQDLSVTNRMTLTTFQDPLKIKAEVALDMATGDDTYNQTITMYARKEGEDLVQYATDGTYWAKQTTTQDVLDTYNAGDTLGGYLDQASGFKKDGTETVNGADAVKYTGSISGAPWWTSWIPTATCPPSPPCPRTSRRRSGPTWRTCPPPLSPCGWTSRATWSRWRWT